MKTYKFTNLENNRIFYVLSSRDQLSAIKEAQRRQLLDEKSRYHIKNGKFKYTDRGDNYESHVTG